MASGRRGGRRPRQRPEREVSLFVVAVGAAIYLALLAAVVILLARPRQRRLLVAYLAAGNDDQHRPPALVTLWRAWRLTWSSSTGCGRTDVAETPPEAGPRT